ncbi:MAG: STAS-like domain-containing protein [Peptococcaceae bacterium]|jgi:hypothetical protein|nr:STAS-like domain-containing protein [Peptococcaceae bacterium]
MFFLKLIDMFGANDIGSRHSGRILREKIEAVLGNSNIVLLDFDGINLVTQGFIDEALGVIIRRMGPAFQGRVHFKNCNELVQTVITMVATYSLAMVSESPCSGMPFACGDKEKTARGIEIDNLATVSTTPA